jgi:propionyl-CoA synthetase
VRASARIVTDQLKGQMPLAFAVVRDAARVATPELRAAHEKEVVQAVDQLLGAIARAWSDQPGV